MAVFLRKPSYTELDIRIGPAGLPGHLVVPHGAHGVVAFAHGSGSSRFSSRNQQVAHELQDHAIGTLLFDLLTEEEAANRENVFDIPLLAKRLGEACHWLQEAPETRDLSVGYFGASTGAAAALVAAAENPGPVKAIVSRGGRPDLAGDALSRIKAPTLLIVGGADEVVLDLNRMALDHLQCDKSLQVIPKATHLFPEEGALEEVARLAAHWFASHL